MRAFHTLRTKNKADFRPDDFEIFTLILSALEWRKHNGEIFLFTDSVGRKFFSDLGILEIYDGVNTAFDEIDSLGIDENIFWAGGKFFALKKQIFPCVMIDLDFIVWKKLDFEKFKSDIAVIHRESTDLPCYPDKNYFHFKNNFSLPQDLNWSLEPCNAALVYFGDKNFVEKYCDFAFEFMKNSAPAPELSGWDLLPYMVFVEQRWMAMCAEKCGVKIHSFAKLPELFGRQKFFTHIWGEKKILRDNPQQAEKFCRDCAKRISHDFPEQTEKFFKSNVLKKYFPQ